MAVEPSGDLLVAEFFTGSLLRITPTGRRTRIGDRLVRPCALTRMPDGTIYVVEIRAAWLGDRPAEACFAEGRCDDRGLRST